MPIVVFILFVILCQSATVGISLLVETFGPQWLSVIAFGGLYLVGFGIAWKLTVWTVDSHLRRTRAPAARA